MTITTENHTFADDETELDLRIENLVNGFRNYGYKVLSKPVEGQKLDYYEELKEGLERVDSFLETMQKIHGWQPKGKNVASHYPEPCWGVEA